MDKHLNLAVVIDGDNIPSKYVKEMLEEITKYGNPSIKKINGDWTKPGLVKWKDFLLKNAIIPVQQYRFTTGKNTTASVMDVDTREILFCNKLNSFWTVFSDGDFKRLAVLLWQAGIIVFGVGEKKTRTFLSFLATSSYLLKFCKKPLRGNPMPLRKVIKSKLIL
ncbi:MAG: NYN domain-containing protein [Bacteroidota bacterium]